MKCLKETGPSHKAHSKVSFTVALHVSDESGAQSVIRITPRVYIARKFVLPSAKSFCNGRLLTACLSIPSNVCLGPRKQDFEIK